MGSAEKFVSMIPLPVRVGRAGAHSTSGKKPVDSSAAQTRGSTQGAHGEHYFGRPSGLRGRNRAPAGRAYDRPRPAFPAALQGAGRIVPKSGNNKLFAQPCSRIYGTVLRITKFCVRARFVSATNKNPVGAEGGRPSGAES